MGERGEQTWGDTGGLRLASAQEMSDSALRTGDDLYRCREKVTGEDRQKGHLPLTGLTDSLRRSMCLEVWAR